MRPEKLLEFACGFCISITRMTPIQVLLQHLVHLAAIAESPIPISREHLEDKLIELQGSLRIQPGRRPRALSAFHLHEDRDGTGVFEKSIAGEQFPEEDAQRKLIGTSPIQDFSERASPDRLQD